MPAVRYVSGVSETFTLVAGNITLRAGEKSPCGRKENLRIPVLKPIF